MRRRRLFRYIQAGLVFVAMCTLVGLTAGHRASAAAASGRGGLTISPAFQQVTITADQASTSFDLTLTNNTSQEYEFQLSVTDFGSLDETGGVLFAGSAQKTLNYRYRLSSWVSLERDRVVVGPHSSSKVPVTIVNKESLTPGGHYGAILVTPIDTGDNAGRKVEIDQVVSSLLFMKKQGGEVYRLKLVSSDIKTHIFRLPAATELRFQNSGNVHVIPRGLVRVTDPRGRLVARGVINADSGIVLPETFRRLSVPLLATSRAWLPGRYTLTTDYRYDDQTATSRQQTSFLYFNAGFILSVLTITGLAIAGGILVVTNPVCRRVLGQARRRISRS